MSLWDKVEALVAAGKGAVITLTEAQEVKLERAKKKDMRRNKDRPWETWAGNTNGVSRPRCHRRGCSNRLKKEQPIVCSDVCAQIVVDESLKNLALLRYHVIERLDDYESRLHGGEVLAKALTEV